MRLSPSNGVASDGASEQRVPPKVIQALLVLLRAEARTVSRDDLIDACWGGRVVSDDAVNRVISQLRGLSRQFDPAPFQLHTIPKIGFRLEVAQPPAAAVLQAAPQTEPEAASPAIAGPPALRSRRRAIWIAAAAVLLGGLAWLGVRMALAPPSSRVEVAAFQPLQADADLARVSRATRDATVRVLKAANIPVVEATGAGPAAAADAAFHLRGAVDRDGDAIVINIQVMDRARRNVLWSGRLERPIAAPARFADQAANRIGDTLHCALSSRAKSRGRMSDAVFSLMLQACDLRRVEPDEQPRLLAAAERVRAAAPSLSAAQSIYAMAAAGQAVTAPEAPDAPALVAAARAAARRALEIDPRNGEAYFAIGLSYGFDGAWTEREANFLRAEAQGDGLSYFADLHVGILREVGRLRDARALNLRTVANDPFSPDQLLTLVVLTAAADGREAAEPILQKLRLLASPDQVDAARLITTFWWDEPKVAAALLASTTAVSAADRRCFEAYLAQLQRPAPRRGLPDACRGIQADWRVRMLAREGDIDGAYREVVRAPRGRQFLVAFYYPEMRAFRADPRFMPLAARYGLVDYWTRTGRWPDFCTSAERPYDCAAVARRLAGR